MSQSKSKIQNALKKSKSGRNAIFRHHRFTDAQFGASLNAILESVDLGEGENGAVDKISSHPTDGLMEMDENSVSDSCESESAMIVECVWLQLDNLLDLFICFVIK